MRPAPPPLQTEGKFNVGNEMLSFDCPKAGCGATVTLSVATILKHKGPRPCTECLFVSGRGRVPGAECLAQGALCQRQCRPAAAPGRR